MEQAKKLKKEHLEQFVRSVVQTIVKGNGEVSMRVIVRKGQIATIQISSIESIPVDLLGDRE